MGPAMTATAVEDMGAETPGTVMGVAGVRAIPWTLASSSARGGCFEAPC
jgi:hypothetical protein